MEKEKPFKLFPLPRLSNTQVFAVKPQTVSGDGPYFQGFNKCIEDDFNSHFRKTDPPNPSETKSSDPYSQKVKHLPVIEEETLEPISQLYSKLYREAEKIKRWKGFVESEVKQKEKKLHDNKKTIDAQRKAIQELQFENEKLSLKLEDEINEKKDLLNENNATRHLCDLLKETCARSMEKANIYEREQEESRQLYLELNNNIERMIMAFEELRLQAENSRAEMYFKLKEESERRKQQEKALKMEINEKESQVSLLENQNDEKKKELMDMKFHLHESRNRIAELKEVAKEQNEKLETTNIKLETLTAEFEDMKVSLQTCETDQKRKDIELQTTKDSFLQITVEKETYMEELKDLKFKHASTMNDLQNDICKWRDMFTTEQKRLENSEKIVESLNVELQRKSEECGVLTKLKNDHEIQLGEMRIDLEKIEKLLNEKQQNALSVEELKEAENGLRDIIRVNEEKIQELLNEKEHSSLLVEELNKTQNGLQDIIRVKEEKIQELLNEKEHSALLVEELTKSQNGLKDIIQEKEEKIQELLNEKEHSALLVVELNKTQNGLKDIIRVKEEEISELKIQMTASSGIEENCYKRLAELKAVLSQKELKCQELNMQCERLIAAKEQTSEDINGKLIDIYSLEKALTVSKQNEDKAQKQIQNMEDANNQIRNELEFLKKTLEEEDFKRKLDKSENKTRNVETEIEKKDKQLKTLENKLSTLKKQVENKNKCFDDLQQENKSLKKKITTETKQHRFLDDENETLRKKIDAEIQHWRCLEVENETLRKKIDAEIQHCKCLEVENETLKNKTNAKSQQFKHLEDENEMLKKNLSSECQQCKCLEDENETLKKKINAECEHRKCLEDESNTLKKNIEVKQNQLKCLEDEKESLKQKIASESKQCKCLQDEVAQLNEELHNCKVKYENTIESYKNSVNENNLAQDRLCEEVGKLKLTAEEATKCQKETDIRCQHKIAEMVALMEKHKHQYDKMVEEKHSELGLYKKKEQETMSAKASLELELSNSKDEVLALKKQLQKETVGKELELSNSKDEVLALKKQLQKETVGKITQTSILETPKQSSRNLDSKSVTSSSKSLGQKNNYTGDSKKSENNNIYAWTPAKSRLCTPRKTYTVKTPPKCEKVQKERLNILAAESSIKKRKVSLAFDVSSDSSGTTDLLSLVSEEDKVKKVYVNRSQAPLFSSATPREFHSVSGIKSPGSALKRSTVRKMREAGWTSVSNLDRKKKMKGAERLFS